MHLLAASCAAIGFGALIALLKRYFGGPSCKCTATLRGKTVIVTGATSGIGLETAKELAKRGARVIITARNTGLGEKVKYDICNETGNANIKSLYLDLNKLQSIRDFCEKILKEEKHLDYLVNNAGNFYHPWILTEDGFDVTFQTNYLGHFLLTELLLKRLQETKDSRIIFLSSEAHRLCKSLDFDQTVEQPDNPHSAESKFLAYGRAKLCLLLYANHLSQKVGGLGLDVCSVNPGSVETRIYRHFPFLQNRILALIQAPIRKIVVKTPRQGAETVLHCVLCLKIISGSYYSNLKPATPSQLSKDGNLASALYQRSLLWTGLFRDQPGNGVDCGGLEN